MKMQRFNGRRARLALASGFFCGFSILATSASAAVATVSVVNNRFEPSAVTINQNDQVTWTWSASDGATPHTTTSDTPGLWDSGIKTQPFEFTMNFPTAGSFPYHCTIHAALGMVGSVTVQSSGGGGGGGGGSVSFVKGVYNGLFFDPAGVAQQSSGSFTLTTTPKGKFTGRLQSGNARFPLSGQFDANGAAQKTISARGQSPLQVALQLDPTDSDKITGTVSNGTFTANLSGDRVVFDGRQHQAPQAGRYTMSIAGSSDSASAPGGDSVGSVMVNKSGRVRLTGSLADGTRLSQSAVVSKDGNWPIYVPLYGGKGSILSWITFATNDTTDLGGDVVWIKPAVPSAKLYPDGFTLSTSAQGSTYQPGSGGAVLSSANAELVLNGGDLGGPVTNSITIGSHNRVTTSSGNKLTLTFAPGTGLFQGRVMVPGMSKPVPFSGAVLQKQNVGLGWFQGTHQTGEVILSPQ